MLLEINCFEFKHCLYEFMSLQQSHIARMPPMNHTYKEWNFMTSFTLRKDTREKGGMQPRNRSFGSSGMAVHLALEASERWIQPANPKPEKHPKYTRIQVKSIEHVPETSSIGSNGFSFESVIEDFWTHIIHQRRTAPRAGLNCLTEVHETNFSIPNDFTWQKPSYGSTPIKNHYLFGRVANVKAMHCIIDVFVVVYLFICLVGWLDGGWVGWLVFFLFA